MRKVTRDAAQAFLDGRSGRFGNTTILGLNGSQSGRSARMLLHGNLIARTDDNGETLRVSLAGWPTPTTRERINGLLSLFFGAPTFTGFFQSKHQPMIWYRLPDGSAVEVRADPNAWYTFNRAGELVGQS